MSFDLQLGWIDLTLLGVLAVSVVIGLVRGFVFEIVSLLGWLVAFVLANTLGPMLEPHLPVGHAAAAARLWIAYGLVFVGVLVCCTLLARMLRSLISATPLSVVDRLLGGAFGVARGALVLLVVGMIVSLSPYANAPWWQESHSALWLGQALDGLKPMLPQTLSVHFNA